MSVKMVGGEKFQAKLEKIVQDMAQTNASIVRVGFLQGSTCGIDNSASAPAVAFYNEYGTIGRQTLDTFRASKKLTGGKRSTVQISKRGEIVRESVKTSRVNVKNASGAYHIPPRPFFRLMIEKNKTSWPRLLRALLKQYEYNKAKALAGVGLKMQEQLQISIKSNVPPPNAQSTRLKKGFDQTLQHSKNMLNAVDFELGEQE